MDTDIARILIHREKLAARVQELAAEIAAAYNGDNVELTLVPILSGAMIFVADLIRCTRIFSKPDPQMDQAVDVTVILGKDFDGRWVK